MSHRGATARPHTGGGHLERRDLALAVVELGIDNVEGDLRPWSFDQSGPELNCRHHGHAGSGSRLGIVSGQTEARVDTKIEPSIATALNAAARANRGAYHCGCSARMQWLAGTGAGRAWA